MATTLAGQYSASQDSIFQERVQAAIVATAQAISTEATSTPNHANRVLLMKAAANTPGAYTPVFALLLATQQVDQASTDAAITAMVSSTWNTAAGVP